MNKKELQKIVTKPLITVDECNDKIQQEKQAVAREILYVIDEFISLECNSGKRQCKCDWCREFKPLMKKYKYEK